MTQHRCSQPHSAAFVRTKHKRPRNAARPQALQNLCGPEKRISWTAVQGARRFTPWKGRRTMNAKVEAATTGDCEVEGSRGTECALDTSRDIPRSGLQCVAKAEFYAQDQIWLVQKTKAQGSQSGHARLKSLPQNVRDIENRQWTVVAPTTR